MTNDGDCIFGEPNPHWKCDECGFVDNDKPMPINRESWYAKKKNAKCPRCKSESLVPVGW